MESNNTIDTTSHLNQNNPQNTIKPEIKNDFSMDYVNCTISDIDVTQPGNLSVSSQGDDISPQNLSHQDDESSEDHIDDLLSQITDLIESDDSLPLISRHKPHSNMSSQMKANSSCALESDVSRETSAESKDVSTSFAQIPTYMVDKSSTPEDGSNTDSDVLNKIRTPMVSPALTPSMLETLSSRNNSVNTSSLLPSYRPTENITLPLKSDIPKANTIQSTDSSDPQNQSAQTEDDTSLLKGKTLTLKKGVKSSLHAYQPPGRLVQPYAIQNALNTDEKPVENQGNPKPQSPSENDNSSNQSSSEPQLGQSLGAFKNTTSETSPNEPIHHQSSIESSETSFSPVTSSSVIDSQSLDISSETSNSSRDSEESVDVNSIGLPEMKESSGSINNLMGQVLGMTPASFRSDRHVEILIAQEDLMSTPNDHGDYPRSISSGSSNPQARNPSSRASVSQELQSQPQSSSSSKDPTLNQSYEDIISQNDVISTHNDSLVATHSIQESNHESSLEISKSPSSAETPPQNSSSEIDLTDSVQPAPQEQSSSRIDSNTTEPQNESNIPASSSQIQSLESSLSNKSVSQQKETFQSELYDNSGTLKSQSSISFDEQPINIHGDSRDTLNQDSNASISERNPGSSSSSPTSTNIQTDSSSSSLLLLSSSGSSKSVHDSIDGMKNENELDIISTPHNVVDISSVIDSENADDNNLENFHSNNISGDGLSSIVSNPNSPRPGSNCDNRESSSSNSQIEQGPENDSSLNFNIDIETANQADLKSSNVSENSSLSSLSIISNSYKTPGPTKSGMDGYSNQEHNIDETQMEYNLDPQNDNILPDQDLNISQGNSDLTSSQQDSSLDTSISDNPYSITGENILESNPTTADSVKASSSKSSFADNSKNRSNSSQSQQISVKSRNSAISSTASINSLLAEISFDTLNSVNVSPNSSNETVIYSSSSPSNELSPNGTESIKNLNLQENSDSSSKINVLSQSTDQLSYGEPDIGNSEDSTTVSSSSFSVLKDSVVRTGSSDSKSLREKIDTLSNSHEMDSSSSSHHIVENNSENLLENPLQSSLSSSGSQKSVVDNTKVDLETREEDFEINPQTSAFSNKSPSVSSSQPRKSSQTTRSIQSSSSRSSRSSRQSNRSTRGLNSPGLSNSQSRIRPQSMASHKSSRRENLQSQSSLHSSSSRQRIQLNDSFSNQNVVEPSNSEKSPSRGSISQISKNSSVSSIGRLRSKSSSRNSSRNSKGSDQSSLGTHSQGEIKLSSSNPISYDPIKKTDSKVSSTDPVQKEPADTQNSTVLKTKDLTHIEESNQHPSTTGQNRSKYKKKPGKPTHVSKKSKSVVSSKAEPQQRSSRSAKVSKKNLVSSHRSPRSLLKNHSSSPRRDNKKKKLSSIEDNPLSKSGQNNTTSAVISETNDIVTKSAPISNKKVHQKKKKKKVKSSLTKTNGDDSSSNATTQSVPEPLHNPSVQEIFRKSSRKKPHQSSTTNSKSAKSSTSAPSDAQLSRNSDPKSLESFAKTKYKASRPKVHASLSSTSSSKNPVAIKARSSKSSKKTPTKHSTKSSSEDTSAVVVTFTETTVSIEKTSQGTSSPTKSPSSSKLATDPGHHTISKSKSLSPLPSKTQSNQKSSKYTKPRKSSSKSKSSKSSKSSKGSSSCSSLPSSSKTKPKTWALIPSVKKKNSSKKKSSNFTPSYLPEYVRKPTHPYLNPDNQSRLKHTSRRDKIHKQKLSADKRKFEKDQYKSHLSRQKLMKRLNDDDLDPCTHELPWNPYRRLAPPSGNIPSELKVRKNRSSDDSKNATDQK